MTPEDTAALIQRRRRQVVLHSFLYYRMDEPIISDAVFDKWSVELVRLQASYPLISKKVAYHLDYFKDWDGSTGCDIPFTRADELNAARVMHYHHSKGGRVE